MIEINATEVYSVTQSVKQVLLSHFDSIPLTFEK